ncbi:hypothetical protein MMC25_001171 [Agyrium rufum]|nr:hypothetical protein [Agyrium rufum]
MSKTLDVVLGTLYYILYPLLAVGKAILRIASTLATPFVHVANSVIHILLWPWRFLGRFETLYIYFGVAIVIGLLTGACLHLIVRLGVFVLDLNPTPPIQKGKTLAEYRADKAEQLASTPQYEIPTVGSQTPLSDEGYEIVPNLNSQDKAYHAKGLLRTTILEEDDSSDHF